MNTAQDLELDTRAPFTKIVHIGSYEDRWMSSVRRIPVFCKIQWDSHRLSITGVEGPLRDGNALGSCGQLDLNDRAFIEYAAGWDRPKVDAFAALWKRWHLNDMRAGCEHQRADQASAEEKVEVVTYKLTSDALMEQRFIETAAMLRLSTGQSVTLTVDEQNLVNLPYRRHDAPDAEGPGSGRYEVESREMKYVSHTYPNEHPKGLLCKPCSVCGYKYGSRWLHEEVPTNVLDVLRSLPDADRQPAWI